MIETIQAIGIAILRKILIMTIVTAGWYFLDKKYYKAFNTDKELKGNPNAIAIMYGLWAIAFALC
jgi:hypothetical protein